MLADGQHILRNPRSNVVPRIDPPILFLLFFGTVSTEKYYSRDSVKTRGAAILSNAITFIAIYASRFEMLLQ